MENKIQDDILNQPIKELKDILVADDFLRQHNIWSNYHLNNLVITTLSCCSKFKNASFEIDTNKKEIKAIFFLGRWNYLFTSRKKIIQKIEKLYSEYIPEYNVHIVFQIYKNK